MGAKWFAAICAFGGGARSANTDYGSW